MITFRSALLLVILSALLQGAQPSGYKLVWADEFNGSRVDTARWNYRTDSRHWSTQKPEKVQVSDGNLVMILKKEKAGDREYTGAGLISKQAFRFGYYEARFRIDAGKGWHTSFWMMGHDGSEPLWRESAQVAGDHVGVGGRKDYQAACFTITSGSTPKVSKDA